MGMELVTDRELRETGNDKRTLNGLENQNTKLNQKNTKQGL